MQNVLKTAEEKMKKSINVLDSDYKAIRAGRANPAVLDKIVVDYYGAETPINQMAAISVSEARVLVVQPWDASMLKEIEKAIGGKVSDVFERDFYSVNEELPQYQRFMKPYLELENKVDKLVAEGKIGKATGESIKLRSGVENS